MRVVDADYKLRQSIKVAMLYLEDDDAVSAEMFIKKAATLIATCKARLALAPERVMAAAIRLVQQAQAFAGGACLCSPAGAALPRLFLAVLRESTLSSLSACIQPQATLSSTVYAAVLAR